MSNTSEIVLTAPATEMSTHHGKEFLGFGTFTHLGVIPSWFMKLFFYPKVKNKNGVIKFAPYGLRKVELAFVVKVKDEAKTGKYGLKLKVRFDRIDDLLYLDTYFSQLVPVQKTVQGKMKLSLISMRFLRRDTSLDTRKKVET